MGTQKGQHGGAWDEDRVERLKHLIRIGAGSARQIGDLLGVNRSQVIGKCKRMNLALPASNPLKSKARVVPPKPLALKPQRKKVAFVALVEALPLPAADDVARKPLADLEANECRFPVGDPGTPGFGFCASGRVEGLPYCAEHAARCYVVPNNLKSRSKDASEDLSASTLDTSVKELQQA